MKNRIKTIIMAIASLLIIITSAMLITIPSVIAQEPDIVKETFAYIGATPNPIGVNQEVLLHVGITDFLSATRYGWEGLTVTVTKPDGSTETLGPFRTDSTGGTGTLLIPTMVGTYKLQTHFPAQMHTWERPAGFAPGLIGDVLYSASDSEVIDLVVTQEPREYYPTNPLPNEYWTRPIDAQLREWNVIAASWPDSPTNNFAQYNEDAPETAHILWTKPITMGGLVGGEFGPQAMACGAAYEQKGYPPIILNGILFFNKWEERGGETDLEQEVVAVDIHTGETLWSRQLIDPEGINRRLDFGQLFYWDSYNFHGTFAYLWAAVGSTWHAFDAYTGRYVYTIEGVTGGRSMYGPKGEIYKYIVDLENGWLALWNSSRVVSDAGSWRPHGNTYDAMDGIEWNTTLPDGLEFQEFYPYTASVTAAFLGDRIIGSTAGGSQRVGHEPITTWCVSTKLGQEGTLLWQEEWLPPLPDLTISYAGGSLEDGVFIFRSKETRQYWGFDIDTGKEIWGPTDPEHYLQIYGTSTAIAYGNFYSTYMGGIVYCYDIKTGNLKWDYDVVDEYTEILWGNSWPQRFGFIADGKLYLYHGEHSPVDPKPRGAPFTCLDAITGDLVWEFPSMYFYYRSDTIIGDSIIAILDSYDQRFYAIGKGPSATTISAPDAGVTKGAPFMIRGKVTDISPGTKDDGIMMRFPGGVPAVADEDMSEWMKYVHQQFARPTDVNGVPVKIEVIDPNGEYSWIGTATSDMDGNYAYMFSPEVEGKYMIIATFDGSKSYYGSHAITYVPVGPAATPSVPITPGETPIPETPLITTEVAVVLVAAIAAIVIVAIFALRRRK
jgi:outer membrane protein assembly factor BamB